MKLSYQADKIKRMLADIEGLKSGLEEIYGALDTERRSYKEEWLRLFEKSCLESRLSWCTYCNQVKDSSYLTIAYLEHYRTDQYDPQSFLDYVEKHRVCSICNEKPSFKTKTDWPKMTRDQTTEKIPRGKAYDELLLRLDFPPLEVKLDDKS